MSGFWELVDADDWLSYGVGCYIFSIRSGKGGVIPWYVGKTDKLFRGECFQPHKLLHYNEALASKSAATPLLTLIPRYTPTGALAKRRKSGIYAGTEFLEKMLIGACLDRNPALCNARDTKRLKEMVVYGLLNSPKGAGSSKKVQAFRKLLGG